MTITAFHETIKASTDDALKNQLSALPNHAPRLKKAMAHALLAGGKRMRPLLVHLIGEAINADSRDCMAISLAIECIHAYSLVHDDLPAMDDDDLRRGKPTCHIAFDEATAILAGDALQTMAFSVLSDAPMSEFADARRIKLVSLLASASGFNGMCGGQAIDLAATGQIIDMDSLTRLHSLKTGALLSACAQMTTTVSDNISEEHARALLSFSQSVGLAFQIQDDILDVEGSSQVIGKSAGADEAKGKNTYPALLGMREAKAELTRLHNAALQALQALPYNTEKLVAFSELMITRDH